MAKKFLFRGKTLEELQKLSIEELGNILGARQRRKFKRGFTDSEKKLLKKIRSSGDKYIKTHVRDMIVLPEMVGLKIGIYNGREYVMVVIDPSMIGHYFGEFAQTRNKIMHSAPGLGATKSSKSVPLK